MKKRLSERTRIVFSIKFAKEYKNYSLVGSPRGEIVNISDLGVCIVSNISLSFNTDIDFVVILPDKYKFNKLPVSINGRVMWKDKHYGIKYPYKYGVKFNDLGEDSIKQIKKVLDCETKILADKMWQTSHPKISFPSLPLSSELLKDMNPSALSVDVTNLCNLKCRHCFWAEYEGELFCGTQETVLDSMKNTLKKFPSITNVLWYGGEPLFNQRTIDIIKEGSKIAKNNVVITNGTKPLVYMGDNLHYGVSLDGTRETHNFLRQAPIYDKVKINITAALKENIPVGILYCINALNIDCIDAFVEQWANTGVYGIGFTQYTPFRKSFSSLRLQSQHRKQIVKTLLSLKDKYGDLITNSKTMINLFHEKYNKELAKNCPMNLFNKKQRVYCFHLCNDGTIRIPCSIGKDAVHEECRSITKMALYSSIFFKDKEAQKILLKLFISKSHYRKQQ